MARGLGPSGLARAPHERGGQKKGDFSHLGDSPPLPAVLTASTAKRESILKRFCGRNEREPKKLASIYR